MRKNLLIRKLKEEVENCHNCNLHKGRKNVVFGSGNIYSKILFIGEAPGKNEDEKGIPFCGKAGKILDNLLDLINLKRENIFITNVVKCRPPKNRKPKEEEIEKCKKYLEKQIEIINPKIICCLGEIALKFIFEKFKIKKKAKINEIHGKVIDVSEKKIIPLFHPAYAVYNPKKFEIMKKDFINLKDLLCLIFIF
ncbi:MAG: uracil-DNA glycosylase [Candidatus Omnitrophica bacterium]|nr:uracil-DNA glycosylase [Candidatus Omnitrophota bacterium]MCM8806668.1 uracil-DNA glycosylase [Candidatus Omnitrophota bacterium]